MKKIIPMLGVLCLGIQAYPGNYGTDTAGSQSFEAARGSAGNAAAAVNEDSSTFFDLPSEKPCCNADCVTAAIFGLCMQQGCSAGAHYTGSDLPEWDRSFFSSVSRDHMNYRITPAAVEMDSDVYTVKGGFRARKEKLSFSTQLRYSLSDGNGVLGGLDSETYGLLLLSGYQLLAQREHLIDLRVYGLLDVSYLSRDRSDDQWQVMPGAGVAAARITSIGLFSAACTFNHSRNLSGNNEVSGSDYLNMPELIADYTLPIGQKFYMSVGAQHSYFENVSGSKGDRFTEIRLTPVGYRGDVWGASLALSQSVDGNDNNGAAVQLTRAW